jgi:CrcB protein
MLSILYVGIGGFFGCISRYLITNWTQQVLGSTSFPTGTLMVNVVGCLAIGLIAGLIESRQILSEGMRVLVITGFLGGFTTYSAFGLQTTNLIRDDSMLIGLTNIGLHILLGIGAAWLGYFAILRNS